MFSEIILLDSNPTKIKGGQDWFKSFKGIKQFCKLDYDSLCHGLNETKQNYDLFFQENAFTTFEVYSEFLRFHKILQRSFDYFNYKNGNARLRGRAKINKKIYQEILSYMVEIEKEIKNSIYHPLLCEDYIDLKDRLKNLEKRLNLKQNNKFDADISLVATALSRSKENLKTTIFTPDKDISLLLEQTMKNFLLFDIEGYENNPRIESNIKIFNTYNGYNILSSRCFN